jgi:hypothetical protein
LRRFFALSAAIALNIRLSDPIRQDGQQGQVLATTVQSLYVLLKELNKLLADFFDSHVARPSLTDSKRRCYTAGFFEYSCGEQAMLAWVYR